MHPSNGHQYCAQALYDALRDVPNVARSHGLCKVDSTAMACTIMASTDMVRAAPGSGSHGLCNMDSTVTACILMAYIGMVRTGTVSVCWPVLTHISYRRDRSDTY